MEVRYPNLNAPVTTGVYQFIGAADLEANGRMDLHLDRFKERNV